MTETALGRVQPLFTGAYSSSRTYYKLENVLYNSSTWVCTADSARDQTPYEGSDYWKLVARQGEQGIQGIPGVAAGFGSQYGEITMLDPDADPSITITPRSGTPDSAKSFDFAFSIPKGPKGFDSVGAGASSLPAGQSPSAQARLIEITEDNTQLRFDFGIPSADGEGVKKVDGISPTGDNVELGAVVYSRSLREGSNPITPTQQQMARDNINAQIAGTYITEPSASSGQFLQYSNLGEWQAVDINLVPSGSSSDIGKYLRKTSTGMLWAEVQSLPSGGSEGAPLVKNSIDNYDVTWGSFISNSDIDTIVNV